MAKITRSVAQTLLATLQRRRTVGCLCIQFLPERVLLGRVVEKERKTGEGERVAAW